MLDGQPPIETPPATPDSSQPPAGEPEDDSTVASGAKTVEEVEEFWRKRVSAKDRGHDAAQKVLREQLESRERELEQLRASAATQPNGQPGGQDSEAARLRQELEQQKILNAALARRGKYPAASERIKDDRVFAAMDEATLAALNAELDTPSGGGRIAPTSPKRPTPGVRKDPADQTKEELEAALKRSIEMGGHIARR